ncbi:MAG: hypothetical protein EXR75_02305 [Myxococcales bacterium]|nr:hypothetical protein [Myxococcales bacterium]
MPATPPAAGLPATPAAAGLPAAAPPAAAGLPASTPPASPPAAAAAAVTAPAAAGPAVAAPVVRAPGAVDAATHSVRLRDLQQRIDQLKEQIRRSHTRLSLLSDTILSSGAAGSRASIQLENKLSSLFSVTKALVVLDGAVQYNKADRSGVLSEQKTIPVFSGSIPPGDHLVQVLVNLRGDGYGVFSYLRGYRFEVRSSHSFTALEGKTTRLRILAYEKGGATTPLEERPAIRYLEKIVSGLVEAGTGN